MPGRRITAEPPPLVDQVPTLGPPSAQAQQGSFMAPPEEHQDRRLIDQGPAVEEIVLSLDERMQFSTLLGCGKRGKTIDVMGHEVTIENLDTDDDLRVGLFCKPYVGSEAYERAYQLATCGAGVRSLGGRPLYTALEEAPSAQGIFEEKVRKLGKYRPVVITEIYREILSLDVEFVELATKLGKLKG